MIESRRLSFWRGFNAHHFAAYFLRRLFVSPHLRAAAARLAALRVNWRRGRPVTAGTSESVAQRLREQGCALLAPFLNDRQIGEIRTYLQAHTGIAGGRRVVVDEHTSGIQRAIYPLATILACPHLLELANHPELLDIAGAYLGCVPTISTVGLQWTFPGAWDPSSVQRFHRDTEDWRFVKFFVYLSDVETDSGPHRYVLASHRKRAKLRGAHDDAGVVEKHGAERILTITGPRGTNFIEDTWGIHKGEPPSARPRLMFDVMYSVGPVPLYEYRPVTLPGAHRYDRYVNRLILA